MIAVGYCRFSSDMQRDGYSIEAQKDAISKYCNNNAIKLIDFYIDEAISGTTDERPSFQRMIKDSSLKHFDAVIVHKLDRFSRNKYDSAIYKKRLKDNKVKLISVLERLDDSPESVILESLLEGMSEYYSRNLSREVRKGQRIAASKGYRHGNIPIGYKLAEDRKKLIVDEDKRAIIVKAFQMKANSERTLDIFKYLKVNGIDVKYPTRVNDILENKTYKGIYVYAKRTDHREEFKGVIEPIVSEDLWNSANQQIKRNLGRDRTYHNLLAGLVYCSKCGAHLNSTSNRAHRYYCCSNRVGTKFDNNGNAIKSCNYPYVHAPELEQDVLNNVMKLFTDEKILMTIKNRVNGYKNNTDENKIKIEQYRKNIKRINSQLTKLVDLMLSDMIEKDEYAKRFKEYNEPKLSETVKLSHLLKTSKDINIDIETVIKSLKEIFNLNSIEDHKARRKLLVKIIDKIVMHESGYTIYYKLDNLISNYSYSLTKSERTSHSLNYILNILVNMTFERYYSSTILKAYLGFIKKHT